jgi:NAD-dependent SIR2 family protein deacetylase
MENTNIEKTELIISANDLVEKMSSTSEKNAACEYLFNGKKINELMEIEDDRKKVEKENELISCIINNFINKQFENTIVLTGAGASIISNDNKYKGYSGKTVSGLTEEIYNYLSNKKEEINIYSLEELVKEVKYLPENEKFDLEKVNIEDLLSKVESAKEYLNLDQDSKFIKTLEEIEKQIYKLCNLTVHDDHPHKLFLNKIITRRKSHNRVKIFTTNYDTLFEQAAEKEGFILIDGFSYNFPRTLNPYNFDIDFVRRDDTRLVDEPDYLEKVIHLYKLHGSVDWEKCEEDKIVKTENPNKPLMIYPRKNKYEQSYEPPYFEMFSRFQNELRKRNTLLITIGFSFADKHIRTIVQNAIINNPSLNIIIVDYDISQDNYDFFRNRALKGHQNIMLYQATFSEFTKVFLEQKAYSQRFFEKLGGNNND